MTSIFHLSLDIAIPNKKKMKNKSFVEQVRRIISVIRLKPFDLSSPEGRSNERFRRLVLSAVTSAAAQLTGIATSIILVPILIKYLGMERYGLWISVSSAVAILGVTDLGLGNGLLNVISEANGKKDHKMAVQYISSTFAVVCCIAIFFLGGFILLYQKINWIPLFNVTTAQAIADTGPTVAILIGGTFVNMPISIIQKIQRGYQEEFIHNLWQIANKLLLFGSIYLLISLNSSLPRIALAFMCVPFIVAVLNSTTWFIFYRPWLKPKIQEIKIVAVKRIFNIGVLFLILQLAMILGYQMDSLVIAHFMGAEYVPQYAIPVKLFIIIPTILGFALTPLWPAYGEAIANKDKDWVRKTFFRSVKLASIVCLITLSLLLIFLKDLLYLWVGSEIKPSLLLIIGLSLWTFMSSLNGPIAMLLNGLGVIGFQVVFNILMTIANLTLSIFLVQKIGVSGPVFGSILAQVLFILIPFGFYFPRLLEGQSNNKEKSK